MATPPTFEAEYEVADWTVSTTPRTVTPTTNSGDKLVVAAVTADELTQLTSPPTGNSLTYTLAQSITLTDWCQAYGWTAPDDTGGAGWTLSVSETGSGAPPWGFTALRFSGSDGFGASAKTNVDGAAPSLDITTQQDNSAIVVMVGDWNAVDGSSRTWRTVNGITPTAANSLERVYARDAVNYTVYVAYYSDAGTAGTKTVGLSAPTGQKYSIIAIEVKGTASGGGPAAPPVLSFRPGKTWRRRYKHRQQLFASPPAVTDVTVNAEDAEFTFLAQDAVAAVGVNADPVALTIAGQDAVAGVGANGDVAAISLVANDATAAVSVNAECATWTLAGNDATAAVGANAENALWTLTGQDAVPALGANAGAVALTLAAQDATAAIGANAEFAPINLVANDATVQVSGSINAPAECATWTLAAADATAAVSPNADVAQVTLTTNDAAIGIGVPADLATLLFTAQAVATAPPLIAYVEVIGGSTAGTIGVGSTSGTLEGGSTSTAIGGSSTGGQVEGTTTPAGLLS